MSLTSLEICAGAGGQALGLEQAGFEHVAVAEIDPDACDTLRVNRGSVWKVIEGDIRDLDGCQFEGIDLLAGGVPCQPFSVGGLQLGHADERDLFPEALRLIGESRPRAVMLENVKGLAQRKFTNYRWQVSERLYELGYTNTWWYGINARDYGVPQLRPRLVLIALREPWGHRFEWPWGQIPASAAGTVLYDLMAERGWPGAYDWAVKRCNDIAPTNRGRQQEARRPRPGADPGAGRLAGAGRQRQLDRRAGPGPRRPDRPPAQADQPHGRPAPGLPGRVGLLRRQDRRLPAGRQRLPAARRPAPRPGDRHRAERRTVMARLPSEMYLMQQNNGLVALFEDMGERDVVIFDPVGIGL
jgi:DNA (cytosine-5)-methyltransferase 1